MAQYRDDESIDEISNSNSDTKSSRQLNTPDSEEEEVLPSHVRNSLDLAKYDQEVLQQEDEQEQLLSESSKGSTFQDRIKAAKQAQKDARRLERQIKEHGTTKKGTRPRRKELMYELEEGGPRSRTPSSDGSLPSPEEKLAYRPRKKKSTLARCCRFTCLHIFIVALFAVVVLGAFRATRATRTRNFKGPYRTNGTSVFGPTTILISLDGFRADFLERGITPHLKELMLKGVSTHYMTPSFPSVTFPNHFTLVTGLYPESHGIVGNHFWAPEFNEDFYYTDKKHSMQPKWWLAEPLWETAEDQGVPTAIHMWPGSEAHIGKHDPSFVDKFNGTELLSRKVDRIFEFVDKPGPADNGASQQDPRPQFIAAYVPDVDSDGHLYGPNSTEITETIIHVDSMVGDIVAGLAQRNLTQVINLVIVSDHGMATTSADRLVQLEDYVDTSLVSRIEGWPHVGLRPKKAVDVNELYNDILERVGKDAPFDVYLRDHNMPERYHFHQSQRIAPLWLIPKIGWNIVNYNEYNVKEMKKNGDIYHPRGVHGYDHEDPLMRAIFVAQGPSFPHTPGSKVQPFQNTNVYNIICDSLGVVAKPNNGTLRLPLKTTSEEEAVNVPEADKDLEEQPSNEGTEVPVDSGPEDDPAADESDDMAPTRPTIDKGNEDKHGGKWDDFLDWVDHKLHDLEEWAKGHGGSDNSPDEPI